MIISLSNALSILDVISVIVVILLAVCAIALLACISPMMYDIEHRFSLKETLCMHMWYLYLCKCCVHVGTCECTQAYGEGRGWHHMSSSSVVLQFDKVLNLDLTTVLDSDITNIRFLYKNWSFAVVCLGIIFITTIFQTGLKN